MRYKTPFYLLVSLGCSFLLYTLFATSLANEALFSDSAATIGEEAPQREMRGVWMATVLNIDYPQTATIDPATLQADFRSQLTRLRKIGINTLFVQVRPTADAIYPSKLAPWSKWLTGRDGLAPEINFDPLKFMIQEAHAQGIEFHAWVNPYRVSVDLDTLALSEDHVFNKHRNWVKQYGDRLFLDPGIPEVQHHLTSVIGEIVDNYDVDGIHFDDYFYPYPVQGETFPDRTSFELYGRGFSTKEDWRRNNVNTFVRSVNKLIKKRKPWVKFGISPFGVWRNKDKDPMGSDTRAYASSYDELYGDALAWANEEIVDYLIPQLYWHIGYELADYEHLLDWWTKHTHSNVTLYIGHAAYKVGSDRQIAWHSLEELPKQINLNRKNPRIAGSVFFSAKSLLSSPVELDIRLSDMFTGRRLVPEQKGAKTAPPSAPNILKYKYTSKGPRVVWEVDKTVTDDQLPYYYAIYRRLTEEDNPELIHITPFGQNCRRLHYYDEALSSWKDIEPLYEVRAVDRYHRESTVALP